MRWEELFSDDPRTAFERGKIDFRQSVLEALDHRSINHMQYPVWLDRDSLLELIELVEDDGFRALTGSLEETLQKLKEALRD